MPKRPDAGKPERTFAETDMEVFGLADRLQFLIITRGGGSARELARKAGLSEKHVSMLLRRAGERETAAFAGKEPRGGGVTLDVIRKIADGAGVSRAWLAWGQGPMDTANIPVELARVFSVQRRQIWMPEVGVLLIELALRMRAATIQYAPLSEDEWIRLGDAFDAAVLAAYNARDLRGARRAQGKSEVAPIPSHERMPMAPLSEVAMHELEDAIRQAPATVIVVPQEANTAALKRLKTKFPDTE